MTIGNRLACYLDECVDVYLAEALRTRGFIAITAQEAAFRGATDVEQLAFAAARGLVLITHNGSDFRRLHRQYQVGGWFHSGIVILPQTSPLQQLAVRAAMMLDWIALRGDPPFTLYRWGALQLLLTQGFRVPSYDEADVRLAIGREA